MKSILVTCALLNALLSGPAIARPTPAEACVGQASSPPEATSIVHHLPSAAGDLPYLAIDDRQTMRRIRLYYSPSLQHIAGRWAPCLASEMRLLNKYAPDVRRDGRWMDIVFYDGATYHPPARDAKNRWSVRTRDGTEESFKQALLVTVPHEEMHREQDVHGPAPRWFDEGQAQWAGLKVTEVVAADRARRLVQHSTMTAAAHPYPHLGSWGGLIVKPEAIRRQLSPADRIRFDRDPNFHTDGQFSFGPSDMISDTADTVIRYAASLALFGRLEVRFGRAGVIGWTDTVLATGTAPDTVVRSMLSHDLSSDLK